MEKVKDTETTAQKASRTELTRLRKLVKLVPDNKKGVANSLIKELSFMAGTLEELKENITEHGAVDYFKNGKQEMWRESPALKSYNTTIQLNRKCGGKAQPLKATTRLYSVTACYISNCATCYQRKKLQRYSKTAGLWTL